MAERPTVDYFKYSSDESERVSGLAFHDGAFQLLVRDFDTSEQDEESVVRFTEKVAEYAEDYNLDPEHTGVALEYVRDALQRKLDRGD